MSEGVLLDTHVWLWLAEGSSQLPPKIVGVIDKAASGGGVYVSAMSAWEIATLSTKGRIFLKSPVWQWIDEALSAPRIQLLPLDAQIAVESATLPGSFHGDPADRIIVASARVMELTLITRDRSIIKYGKDGYLEVREV